MFNLVANNTINYWGDYDFTTFELPDRTDVMSIFLTWTYANGIVIKDITSYKGKIRIVTKIDVTDVINIL